MKTIKLLSSVLALGLVMLFTQVQAQNVGVAADKQKQANLEKNKKRQAELKKKLNAMTPEQQAEAKKKADIYKRQGGKTNPGNPAKPKAEPNQAAPAKTTGNPALKSKTATDPEPKGAEVKKIHSGKPYWAEQHGQKNAAPAAEPEKKGTRVTAPANVINTVKTTTVTPKAVEKAPATKPKK